MKRSEEEEPKEMKEKRSPEVRLRVKRADVIAGKVRLREEDIRM